jgi:membrane protein YqaA with SNARE-associated domain
MASSTGIAQATRRFSLKRDYLVSAAGLVFTLALCVLAIVYWDYIQITDRYGYFGVFIISILTGVTVLIPIPGLLVVFTLGSILEPFVVGVLAGIGEALGSVAVYVMGYGGHAAIEKLDKIDHRLTNRFENWLHRRGAIAVFLMSSTINPLFYPFALVSGAMHFGVFKFFLMCWAGKTIKGMGVASLGYYGLGSILRLIGIGV